MQVFDANKLFKGEDPIVLTKTKHTGPVRALDFNCFRVLDYKINILLVVLYSNCVCVYRDSDCWTKFCVSV